MNKHAKLAIAHEFATWAGLNSELVTKWRDSFVECDTAVAHGPGHQSISMCERTDSNHKVHLHEDMEWTDDDLRGKPYTYIRRRDGKVFRMAFSDKGWY